MGAYLKGYDPIKLAYREFNMGFGHNWTLCFLGPFFYWFFPTIAHPASEKHALLIYEIKIDGQHTKFSEINRFLGVLMKKSQINWKTCLKSTLTSKDPKIY